MQSSSSESENDEEKRKLLQALDPGFVNGNNWLGTGNGLNTDKNELEDQPTSKRPKNDDVSESPEFGKPYSLEVPPERQSFIAKQLAKSLNEKIKEIRPSHSSQASTTLDANLGIKLFASSLSQVTENDLKENITIGGKRKNTKLKKKSKKKKKTSDSADSSSESDNEKLRSVAVTADWVLGNN